MDMEPLKHYEEKNKYNFEIKICYFKSELESIIYKDKIKYVIDFIILAKKI